MMKIKPQVISNPLTLRLSGSKSESNRLLMIGAYGDFCPQVSNLSDADDTRLLSALIDQVKNADLTCENEINCEDAGTVCRFLLSYLACQKGTWLLTGSQRLLQRPIASLVDTLNSLGASIIYAEKIGFLPLKIIGTDIQGGDAQVDMTLSSQFASSLLLAASTWKRGLNLNLKGKLSSLPYVDLTIAMMKHFGIDIHRNNDVVAVKKKQYQNKPFVVSADWSSASYLYEMFALQNLSELVIDNLDVNSIQGDKVVIEFMQYLGVKTTPKNSGIFLNKTELQQNVTVDFCNCPDLFPAVVATCAALQVKLAFSGYENLSFKESDRLLAMQTELQKIGARFEIVSEGVMEMQPPQKLPYFSSIEPVYFSAHNDHRIAMSLAPLALKIGVVVLDEPNVVSKSFPDFWKFSQQIGLQIETDFIP